MQAGEQWLSLPGEGGHVDFAANTEEEDAVLQVMRGELGHVSAERFLSGPGLVNLYRGLVKSGRPGARGVRTQGHHGAGAGGGMPGLSPYP